MINELDEKTINKIAAGEVIERPASVAKELVENAIDAGANEISVHIWDGGKQKIIVQDNGTGMTADDAKKCIKRHATSKIKDYKDLFTVATMGFRGEALSSIAAISRLEILTKNDEGILVSVDGGKDPEIRKAASNKGTKMTVKDLFFNVPARKKFLKSRNYEQKLITDVIMKYSLIHTGIAFRLYADDRIIVDKPITTSIKENIASIYGIEVARESFEVDWDTVKGAVVRPTVNRASRDYMSVFVNKRYIRSKVIEDAVMDALKSMVFHDRYPIFVLDLTIDPEELDVNVHPAKRIIKFKNETTIFKTVFDAVKDAVSKAELLVEKPNEKQERFSKPRRQRPVVKSYFHKDEGRQQMLSDTSATHENILSQKSGNSKAQNDRPMLDVNIKGQIHKTYILIETKEGYAIIDQHAAHERIMYDTYRNQLKQDDVECQELLAGYEFSVNPSEKSLIIEHMEAINRLGFEVEDFGPGSMTARKIPCNLRLEDWDLGETIIGISQKIESGLGLEDDTMLKYMACRSAIKAGDELNHLQMRKLVEELYEDKSRFTCPHGRPVIINYHLRQVEKDFLRTG